MIAMKNLFLRPFFNQSLRSLTVAITVGLPCFPIYGALLQEAYLKPFNPAANDHFGHCVAISGNTVVVGAPYENSEATGVNDYVNAGNGFAPRSGAVYVFVRTGTNWVQQAYLKASNTEADDGFGSSVSISDDTIVVGAPYEDSADASDQEDNSGADSGAAYVFVRSGNTWIQQAFLKASNADPDDYFGGSVSVSGSTIVVGATLESSAATGVNGNQADNSALFAGAAYVFARVGNTWTQQAYLKASNAEAQDAFGVSVSVSSNTVAVGASGESSNGINYNQSNNGSFAAGAVYVFAREGTNWFQRAYLKASNVDAFDAFGGAVSISGDTLVVGANGEASNFSGVQNTGNHTAEQANNSLSVSGAAYIFVSDASGFEWTQQAYLKASNPGGGDGFGRSVSLSGDVVVVGAYFESSSVTGVNHPTGQADNGAYGSGAAYVFTRAGTAWSQQAYVKASNTGAGSHPSDVGDYFGFTVGVSGDTIVAGAPREDSGSVGINGNQSLNNAPQAGAAYVFAGFAPRSGPEIAVQDSLGADLRDGRAIVELGVVPVGSSRDLTFVIRNHGNDNLTGLNITFGGDHGSDFSVIAPPSSPVASTSNTSFTIRYAPGGVGYRHARLHLANNDGDENPFDIVFTSVPPAPEYTIDTIAGTGVFGFSGDGGVATNAQLANRGGGVALDSVGNLYIADRFNGRVRRADPDGIITTVAGSGMSGFSGDGGPATLAAVTLPIDVAVDSGNNVYFTDLNNRRVRRVDTNGIITTFAGNGVLGTPSGEGGPATQARLGAPTGLCFDSIGTLYIADFGHSLVRKVDTNGIITTVAGTGVSGFSGDGGLATQAQMKWPVAVTVDSAGNVFIADEMDHRVRRVGTNGIITTVAGNGTRGFAGDGGPATNAQVASPTGLATDNAGHLFIAADNRIRRVDANGLIATVAGDGRPNGADGANAHSSPLVFLGPLLVDGAGSILFASGDRVRRITPTGTTFPLQPSYLSTPAPGTLRFPDFAIGATNAVPLSLFIGNAGTSDLRIHSIEWMDFNATEVATVGLPALPHVIPNGNTREAIELSFRWTPDSAGYFETRLRVVSNDPLNPITIYTIVGDAFQIVDQAAENTFAQWFVDSVGANPNLTGGPGKSRKNFSLNGIQTAVLTIKSNTSPTLTAEVPAFLGGGSVQLSNFTGSISVSLLPIPNDFERAAIRVDGGTMTAPSVRLPSGLDTGVNQLTFGAPEQSGGILILTNGSYTAYASARIVNNLIPDGVTVRGNYSGIYNAATGDVISQSQSTDLFEPSNRLLLNHSANGLRLTWANTNVMETATEILGPWMPLTNAVSPYFVVTTNYPQQFFRLRSTAP